MNLPLELQNNPLMDFEPHEVNSWRAWQTAWRRSKSAETLFGLIDRGFWMPVSAGEARARLSFYLRLSDNHLLGAYLGKPGDERPRQAQSTRMRLARAAFGVLVEQLPSDKNELDASKKDLFSGQLLEQLVWFVRPGATGINPWLINIPLMSSEIHSRKHNQSANAFAKSLCDWMFSDQLRDACNAEQWQRVVSLRVNLLQTMRVLGILDLIFKPGLMWHPGHNIDNGCIRELIEIVTNQAIEEPADESWEERQKLWDAVDWPAVKRQSVFGDETAYILVRLHFRDECDHDVEDVSNV